MAMAGGQVAGREFALAHQALLDTRGLQFSFATAPEYTPPAWLKPLLEILAAMAPVLQYVFWGGLILGVLLLAYLLLGELLPDRLFRKSTSIIATDWRPEPATARALLDDADSLAAQGRFGEAIHLLLFRSIDDLAGRRPGVVRPALTSRDIANLDVLPSQPRAAFTRLAQAVERAFFGGQPVGAEVFDAARRDYEAFAFDAGWR